MPSPKASTATPGFASDEARSLNREEAVRPHDRCTARYRLHRAAAGDLALDRERDRVRVVVGLVHDVDEPHAVLEPEGGVPEVVGLALGQLGEHLLDQALVLVVCRPVYAVSRRQKPPPSIVSFWSVR